MDLIELVEKLDFNKEVANEILRYFYQNEKKYLQMLENAYDGEIGEYPLLTRKPKTRLVVILCLLVQKYDEYRQKGISDEIIFDTFNDVSLRVQLHYDKYQKIGLTKEDVIWFRHIMNVEIFKIGPLQYQLFEMIYLDEEYLGETYMNYDSNWKQQIPADTPVLNIHIQSKTDLDPKAVEDSLKQAKLFFEKHFKEKNYQVMTCYSWLLYPKMQDMLKEDSNIRRFANRFEIIGSCDDSSQASEYLFPNWKNINKLSQLQRYFNQHPEDFGYAHGIMKL